MIYNNLQTIIHKVMVNMKTLFIQWNKLHKLRELPFSKLILPIMLRFFRHTLHFQAQYEAQLLILLCIKTPICKQNNLKIQFSNGCQITYFPMYNYFKISHYYRFFPLDIAQLYQYPDQKLQFLISFTETSQQNL